MCFYVLLLANIRCLRLIICLRNRCFILFLFLSKNNEKNLLLQKFIIKIGKGENKMKKVIN